MSRNTNKMNGMMPKLLRKHGFFREKGKPVYVRHTIGLGGIYVEILPKGSRLTVPEFNIVSTFSIVSKLQSAIERLNVIDETESFRWREQVSQFNEEEIGS